MHTKYSITGLLTKDPTKIELETVGNELRLAFSKIGFVYLSGHGIAESEIEDAMKVSKEFFELEEDKKYSVSRPSPLARDGWVAPGRETFLGVGLILWTRVSDKNIQYREILFLRIS